MNVQSAWLSKINWTQAVAALLTLLIALGLPITEEQKVQFLTITGIVAPVLTSVFRTFFTSTVTPAVAAKLEQ